MWIVKLLKIDDDSNVTNNEVTGYTNETDARSVFSRLVKKMREEAIERELEVGITDNKDAFIFEAKYSPEKIMVSVCELETGSAADYIEYENTDIMHYQIIGSYGSDEYWDMANWTPEEILLSTIGNKNFNAYEHSVESCNVKDFEGIPRTKDGRFYIEFDELGQCIFIIKRID